MKRWPVKLLALYALGALVLGTSGLAPVARADQTFPQTGQSIWGPFERYWTANGGLKMFGLPRTGVFPVKDGYDAQWFERALFTYNPSNPDPYKVELQLLGVQVSAGRQSEGPFQRAPQNAGAAASNYFDATGHNLMGKFLDYWRSNGGLPIFGYPISEPFQEQSKSDGKMYVVQYFERNRFELHPDLANTQYDVQLGLLGSELLDRAGGPAAFANLGAPLRYPAPGSGTSPSGYPKSGNAPDYSWVAGQVVVTRIQGGCTFVQTDAESFAPNGEAWSAFQANNGDHVVIFGHLARPGEPVQVCPGGKAYIVERVMLNP
jgi:hypothetical protein